MATMAVATNAINLVYVRIVCLFAFLHMKIKVELRGETNRSFPEFKSSAFFGMRGFARMQYVCSMRAHRNTQYDNVQFRFVIRRVPFDVNSICPAACPPRDSWPTRWLCAHFAAMMNPVCSGLSHRERTAAISLLLGQMSIVNLQNRGINNIGDWTKMACTIFHKTHPSRGWALAEMWNTRCRCAHYFFDCVCDCDIMPIAHPFVYLVLLHRLIPPAAVSRPYSACWKCYYYIKCTLKLFKWAKTLLL